MHSRLFFPNATTIVQTTNVTSLDLRDEHRKELMSLRSPTTALYLILAYSFSVIFLKKYPKTYNLCTLPKTVFCSLNYYESPHDLPASRLVPFQSPLSTADEMLFPKHKHGLALPLLNDLQSCHVSLTIESQLLIVT